MQAILTKSPYSLTYLPLPLASVPVLEVPDLLPIISNALFETSTIPVRSVQCNAYQEQLEPMNTTI